MNMWLEDQESMLPLPHPALRPAAYAGTTEISADNLQG